MNSVRNVLGPLRRELSTDSSFMTTTAQQVNSKLKQERNATLLDLAESELQISGKNVPSLSKEVNSNQVQKIDDFLTLSLVLSGSSNAKLIKTASAQTLN